eukprot:4444710-Amphidinium_carterae.1
MMPMQSKAQWKQLWSETTQTKTEVDRYGVRRGREQNYNDTSVRTKVLYGYRLEIVENLLSLQFIPKRVA